MDLVQKWTLLFLFSIFIIIIYLFLLKWQMCASIFFKESFLQCFKAHIRHTRKTYLYFRQKESVIRMK